MDLGNVRPSDIDFAEMANALSKIARFNGRYRCAAYSVAQHSVMGADALFAESGDTMLAGCFLLHDGHEYLFGDLPRPAADLIGQIAGQMMAQDGMASRAAGPSLVADAIACAKTSIDQAIYRAASLDAYPDAYPVYARQVRQMDERMLRAEGLTLFGPKAAPHLPAARLPAPKLQQPIEPWGAGKAEFAFLDRLERYVGIAVRAAA